MEQLEEPNGENETPVRKRRRGIYLLPNLFTTAGLFAGFYSIVSAMTGQFEAAAIAIFVAMITDGIDGRLARLTNTQSDFGKEYDSLADMVAFGLAPSLVMFEWTLSYLGKLGWLAAFVFTAGAALRLARFNTQVGIDSKRYFQGFASPSAAACLAGMVWVGTEHGLNGQTQSLAIFAFFLTFSIGILMVSNIRYRSFKDLDLKGPVPFFKVLVIALIFAVIMVDPPRVLFAVFLLYAISGPVLTLFQLRKKRALRKSHGTNS